jgi:hypothetical protein
VLDRLGGELRPEPVPAPQPAPERVPMARPPLLKRLRHLRLVTHEPPSRAA